MSTHYNQQYSRSEIEELLETIKDYVRNDKHSMALNENREENRGFVNDYNVNRRKLKEILLCIVVEDFCHSLNNVNRGFEHEILYVFVPKVDLLTGREHSRL